MRRRRSGQGAPATGRRRRWRAPPAPGRRAGRPAPAARAPGGRRASRRIRCWYSASRTTPSGGDDPAGPPVQATMAERRSPASRSNAAASGSATVGTGAFGAGGHREVVVPGDPAVAGADDPVQAARQRANIKGRASRSVGRLCAGDGPAGKRGTEAPNQRTWLIGVRAAYTGIRPGPSSELACTGVTGGVSRSSRRTYPEVGAESGRHRRGHGPGRWCHRRQP